MGHIVFAAPGLGSFHLHERLVRELRSRGHRTTVLCVERTDFTFWCSQGIAAVLLRPSTPDPMRVPLATFAELDCRRRGIRALASRRRRVERRLASLLPAALRWFEHDRPDLLLCHEQRTGVQRMLHFVATELGSRVLWSGPGVLPHTLQIDDEGLDGDARTGRRSAWDFRLLRGDEPFLHAALAAAVGRNVPPSLTRRPPRRPPLRDRLVDAVADAVLARDFDVPGRTTAWRRALAPPPPAPPLAIELPAGPFVAVLLQREDDVRLRLDATSAPPPHRLAIAVQRAARALDPMLRTVAILPRGGLLAGAMAKLRRVPDLHLETAEALPEACLAATAVVTVNAPFAALALLADSPVLHLGAALWGVPGVATSGRFDTLPHDLQRALEDDQPELRKRFLTWLLRHGHVWCSPDEPDFNGLSGLVLEIERRLARSGPFGTRLQYRPGPAWPLAAEPRR